MTISSGPQSPLPLEICSDQLGHGRALLNQQNVDARAPNYCWQRNLLSARTMAHVSRPTIAVHFLLPQQANNVPQADAFGLPCIHQRQQAIEDISRSAALAWFEAWLLLQSTQGTPQTSKSTQSTQACCCSMKSQHGPGRPLVSPNKCLKGGLFCGRCCRSERLVASRSAAI